MIKKIATIMGMPVQVEIADRNVNEKDIEEVFDYLKDIDKKYSPFKNDSEVGKFNRGEKVSAEMMEILDLCEKTKKETGGYFDIVKPDGKIDPSGLVKGWAIWKSSYILKNVGMKKLYIDIAGDAEIVGGPWMWGIRNPFNKKEIIKVLNLSDCGIATSGTYERGQHIYNPITKSAEITDIISITVIGPDVYEADRFATAAFAMGRNGIKFIESRPDLEGYMIDKDGIATMTTGFSRYEKDPSTRDARSG